MADFAEVVVNTVRNLGSAERKEFFTTVLSGLEKRELPELVSILVALIADKPKADGLGTTGPAPRHGQKLPSYDTPGELSGRKNGYSITVRQFPGRRFVTSVDGVEKRRLTMDFVEGALGLRVNRKTAGGNSETLARAIYRYFVDKLNSGDQGVTYGPLAL